MRTMKQALMQLLLKQWVSPIDALNKVGCMSLSQRCGEFQRDSEGWLSPGGSPNWGPHPHIISKWVKLPNGKRCKAYKAVK